MASTLNLCPNCGYNNASPVGGDYLVKDAEGNQVHNSDGTDKTAAYACARCGYSKPSPGAKAPPAGA